MPKTPPATQIPSDPQVPTATNALELHSNWVNGDHKIGTRPDLTGLDLSGRALQGVDLSNAILYRSDFANCNLSGANFQSAELSGAVFRGAILRGANFANALLVNCDFTDAVGVSSAIFGAADLNGVITSDTFKASGTDFVDECLKAASKVYISLLAVCAFSVLTVMATKDIEFVFSTGKLKLPVVNIDISTDLFFLIAPFLIWLSHATLQIQLLRGWEAMVRDLPAVFPDGITVDRKVHPFLINAIVYRHLPRLLGKLPPP